MKNNKVENEELLIEIDSLDDEPKANTKEKTKLKENKIWLIIVLIALVGLGSLYFRDTSTSETDYSDEDYIEYEKQVAIFEEQKDNLVIESSNLNFNKELIAIVANKNDETITDITVEVIFYDGDNKPIEIDSSQIEVLGSNSEGYVKFYDTPENFERYEFLISKEYYLYTNTDVGQYISYEIVESDSYAQDDSLVIKNNYDKTISEASFQIVYYDEDDKIIDVENINFYEIKKKRTQTENIDKVLYDKQTYDEINYSRYEVNLLGASIY